MRTSPALQKQKATSRGHTVGGRLCVSLGPFPAAAAYTPALPLLSRGPLSVVLVTGPLEENGRLVKRETEAQRG